MRLLLIPPLFAALFFLPWSASTARTPPPQGWEERNELREALPQVQKVLQDLQKKVNERRLQVATLEAANLEAESRRGPDPIYERGLAQNREYLYAMEGRLREMEEELARIKRRLGTKP
jgi:hypothetical protein